MTRGYSRVTLVEAGRATAAQTARCGGAGDAQDAARDDLARVTEIA